MTSEEVVKTLHVLREKCVGAYGDAYGFKEALNFAITAIKDLEVCRNELCLYCGQYKQRHLGACDGCRWYEAPNDYNQSQIQCHGC